LDIHKVILEFRNTPSESSKLAPIEVMLNKPDQICLLLAASSVASTNRKLNRLWLGRNVNRRSIIIGQPENVHHST
jgi:hypothetical protein